jgi:hypothetical protein
MVVMNMIDLLHLVASVEKELPVCMCTCCRLWQRRCWQLQGLRPAGWSHAALLRRRYFANHNMSETVITLLVTFHETRAEVNHSRLGISLWCDASSFRWYSCMAYASFSRNLW